MTLACRWTWYAWPTNIHMYSEMYFVLEMELNKEEKQNKLHMKGVYYVYKLNPFYNMDFFPYSIYRLAGKCY